jgi:N-acetylmuramoyl-L-alanine amidase
MTIYLTAGHNVVNGRGTGAHGLFDEAVEAVRLRDALTAHLRLHSLKVVNDRNDTPLQSVLTWLRTTAGAKDVCIDIHFNASANPKASGCEVVVEDKHTLFEGDMARRICYEINKVSGIVIRRGTGIILESQTARGKIGYLHNPRVAHNMLVEVCFCTSPTDVKKYHDNYRAIVHAIAEAIIISL